MVGIDLFSGQGGLSLGAKYAGIKTKMAVEKDPNAACTYAKNLKGATVVIDDVANIQTFKFEKKKDQELVLYGGPPCQGYSNSNQKTRGLDNPKNWLFREFIRCTGLLNPLTGKSHF